MREHNEIWAHLPPISPSGSLPRNFASCQLSIFLYDPVLPICAWALDHPQEHGETASGHIPTP